MSDTQPQVLQLTTKSKVNLERALDARKADIFAVAASNIRAMGETFFTSAMLTILSNPDTEKLLTTTKGLTTAIKAITDAGQVGISFGGPAPLAYFVPKDGGIIMVPHAAGVRHAACYGPGAVLRTVPELLTIRENDGFKIDPAAGTYSFKEGGYNPFDKGRGQIVGYFMRLQFKDGRPDVLRHVTLEKVQQIEAHYSMTGGPAFKKSPEEMHEGKATKYLLRDVFKESAGLAKMILDDDMDELPPMAPPPRDVSQRTDATVERATRAMEPKPEADVVVEQDDVEVVDEAATVETAAAEGDGDTDPAGDKLFD